MSDYSSAETHADIRAIEYPSALTQSSIAGPADGLRPTQPAAAGPVGCSAGFGAKCRRAEGMHETRACCPLGRLAHEGPAENPLYIPHDLGDAASGLSLGGRHWLRNITPRVTGS